MATAVLLSGGAFAVLSLGGGAAAVANTSSCTAPQDTLSGSAFEIDHATSSTAGGANLTVDNVPCIDWLTGGTGSPLRTDVAEKNDLVNNAADDRFGGGTSENSANPTITFGKANNKSDLSHFGVQNEVEPGGKFLNLFWSRANSVNGTTAIDFELNQLFCNPAKTPSNCANNGTGVTPETPLRSNGDRLVTYTLTNGGTVPTISIFTWNGNSTSGSWVNGNVISGGSSPEALGSINLSSITAANSAGLGPFGTLTFGEASVDYKGIFNGITGCEKFGSVYAKSRDSANFTNELTDFIAPTSVQVTNCASPAIATTASSAKLGNAITDSATLTGGASPTGSITFTAYSDSSCTAKVFTSTPVMVSGNNTYSTPGFTPTTSGSYYWIASYSGDNNNNPIAGSCGDSGETSTVTNPTPTISTQATDGTAGGSVSDTATVSGGTNPTGTVTFTAYSDSSCSTTVFTSSAITLSSGKATATFSSPSAPKVYWTASYSGDNNNNPVAEGCGGMNETSSVAKATPKLGTSATAGTAGGSVSDTATVTGGDSPTGTVTFVAYSDSSCTAKVFTSDAIALNAAGQATATFMPGAVGSYNWIASYSGDANNAAVSGKCADGGETSLVSAAAPKLSTSATGATAGGSVSDTATVSGGDSPTGTVTFVAYSDSSCTAKVFTSDAIALNAAGQATASFTPGTVGNYRWIASYSGDANNTAVSGTCGDNGETSAVSQATPKLSTSATGATAGGSISDTATVSGGDSPKGTVTFVLYSDSTCSTKLFTSSAMTLSSGQAMASFTPGAVGSYYWIATYNGDTNNSAVSGTCGDSGEKSVVAQATPTLSTSASGATAGGSVSDTATVSGGDSPTGTVTFVLYSDSTCSTKLFTSSAIALNAAGQATASFTPTAVGSYYWIASYSGDANNTPLAGKCNDSGEKSVVAQATPMLSTSASGATAGGSISDTATVTGGDSPTGTVTFVAYSDSSCSSNVFTSSAIALNAAGQATASFTPTAVGSYYWIASYSGDANNTPLAGKCNDSGEKSVVAQATPKLSTSATAGTAGGSISDTATVTGGDNPTGTVTFTAYSDSSCTAKVFTSNPIALSSGQATASFSPSASGNVFWTASYSGDANNTPVVEGCGGANETSSVAKASPGIATSATTTIINGQPISDSATISSGVSPTGTITFTAYSDSSCATVAFTSQPVQVSGNGTYSTSGFSPAAGTYYWIASYSGDANNNPVAGKCGDSGEQSTVTKPDLQLVKSSNIPSGTTVNPGDQITYTISYSNQGNGDATGVVITDAIPAGTQFVSCSGSCSPGTAASSSETWAIGTVKAGSSGSVTLTVGVLNTVTCSVANTAQISSPDELGSVAHPISSNPLSVSSQPGPNPAGAHASGEAWAVQLVGGILPVAKTPDATSAQTGPGSKTSGNLTALPVNLLGVLSVNLLNAGSTSDVTSQPAQAQQNSTSSVANVNVLNGAVTADAVQSDAQAIANGTGSSFSAAGTTAANLKVEGVSIVNVAPGTIIGLPALLFGAGSYVAVGEQVGSTSQPTPGTTHGGTYAADLAVNGLHVHVTGLLGLILPQDIYIAAARAHADFPQILLCTSAPVQAVSGHAFLASERTDPSLVPILAGFVSIPASGGSASQAPATVTVPGDGSILQAIVGGTSTQGTVTRPVGSTAGSSTSTSTASVGDGKKPAGISVLGGLVTAKLLKSVASSSAGSGGASSNATGTQLIGLSVGGIAIADNPAPNTTIIVPGIARVTLNEQFCENGATLASGCAGTHGTGLTVRTLDIVLLPNNPLGDKPLAQVIVSEAHSDADYGP